MDQIKEMIISYYSHLLGTKSDVQTPFSVEVIQSLHPFRRDSDLVEKLTLIPSYEEITQTVFTMPRDKAPGPDGFPVEFFWEAWLIVKDNTIAAVR